MTTVTVLGAGIMATALSWPLTDNGHEVRLVGTHLDREIIDSLRENGVHSDLDLKVPAGVRSYQLEKAEEAFEGAEIVMSGVNSLGVHWASEQLASLLKRDVMVISVTKGMEADAEGNLRVLPEVLAVQVPEEVRGRVSWSAITGPSIAGEVAPCGEIPAWCLPGRTRTFWRGWPGPSAPITTTCGPAWTSSDARRARR